VCLVTNIADPRLVSEVSFFNRDIIVNFNIIKRIIDVVLSIWQLEKEVILITQELLIALSLLPLPFFDGWRGLCSQ